MSEVLLEIRKMELRYGAAIAVRDISLSVKRGQLVAVIGNNGAGKSSMVRGATGLVYPSRGQVFFRGQDTTGLSADRKVSRGLVMVPEGRLLFPDQTVEDNLVLGAYLHGGLKHKASRSTLQKTLELFPRLKERLHQQAGSLSGGEQQMLAIARGLMAQPELLIVDELSLGLAPKIVDQLIRALSDLNKEGLTIVLVEQLASYALAIADYGFVIANGRIAREGPSSVLSRDPEVMESFLGKKKSTSSTPKPKE
ncbi:MULTISPECIES: ABC transporter ATP-binding protein [Bradyrhizobium]|jgi:branched-chain amino acid transport system ATP-binding protein|uniref:Amino acid/amide ABC transporter ATP-binding protein 2, HAAT family n=2 Tax=Bradyrhizobium TaxID=374 RepID=A0ABY0PBV7_9BRAD|nr:MULTISPECIES: ABC transporter ATP-binding protein [Bradyrhizobium]SDI02984.1 amino acid/amide ABC transporter ATP-binding protein 2, HAAT family [Bradyrhizobium ottawaense]SED87254.1 amino acid/amide ABC transporter ATP-binding protein 2, HAAT family [Bradyrhizobium lablabi]SHL83207.1 amino acid/amide ABC transporter ATP-binding protein 2, HAAT family [Bradyrhizobium lablabi]